MLAQGIHCAAGIARVGEKSNDNGFNVGMAVKHSKTSFTEMMNLLMLFTRKK